MGEVQCIVDSIRVAGVCPDELTLILRHEGSDSYIPIWLTVSQAAIVASQLHGQPDSREELAAFLASRNATCSDIQCTTAYLEDHTFLRK